MPGIIKGLGGWQKNSFLDYPGTVSTVLFFNRCNLECPYCHNPQFINGELTEEHLSNEFWEFLNKREGLIKGVVFSGGEATLFDSVIDLSAEIRSLGFKIKLDTNGLLPERINAISPDYLAVDLKGNLKSYSQLLNAKGNLVEDKLMESLAIAKSMKYNSEVRITAAPGIVDKDTVKIIAPLLKGIKNVYLQKLNLNNPVLNKGFFKETESYSDETIKEYQKILLEFCEICEIR